MIYVLRAALLLLHAFSIHSAYSSIRAIYGQYIVLCDSFNTCYCPLNVFIILCFLDGLTTQSCDRHQSCCNIECVEQKQPVICDPSHPSRSACARFKASQDRYEIRGSANAPPVHLGGNLQKRLRCGSLWLATSRTRHPRGFHVSSACPNLKHPLLISPHLDSLHSHSYSGFCTR